MVEVAVWKVDCHSAEAVIEPVSAEHDDGEDKIGVSGGNRVVEEVVSDGCAIWINIAITRLFLSLLASII